MDFNLSTGKSSGLDNSVPLRKYKVSSHAELTSLIDLILGEMVQVKGLVGSRPSDLKKLRWHIQFFLSNLYFVYRKDTTRYVGYSRNGNKFKKGTVYRDKFKLSHEYSVNKVLRFLDDYEYIETYGGFYDWGNPSRSRQSRMKATKKLIDLIEEEQEIIPEVIEPEVIEPDDSGKELIVVKGLKPKPTYRYVIENGKKKRKKIKRPRKVCKTPDKPIVRKMRQNLEKINAVLKEAEITLDVTEKELQELNSRLRKDRDPYKQAVDFSRKSLHRVFIDRRLDRHGRFYGGWWQNIPKEYREKILIDGAPTFEADYSGFHPRILYALKGMSLPEDPYRLDGFPDTEEMRGFIKILLLTIINSKD